MDPFRHVSTGERVRIPARTWNGIIDTVLAHERPYALGAGELFGTAEPPGVILAKNTTATAIDRFRVVGFGSLVLNATKLGFLERMAIEARLPTVDDHTVFGVTQEILRPDQFGRVMIFGVTYLRVNAKHDDDEYAEVEADSHVAQSTPLGPIQLLKMTPGSTTPQERWCIARIGHLQTVTRFGKADADIPAEGTGTVSVYRTFAGAGTDTNRNLTGVYAPAPVAMDLMASVTWVEGKRIIMPLECA